MLKKDESSYKSSENARNVEIHRWDIQVVSVDEEGA